MKQTGLIRLRDVLRGESAGNSPELLIVGPVEELEGPGSIFDRFAWPRRHVRSCQEVFLQVWARAPRVVVCERDLPDGDWKDVLAIALSLPVPPPVIVTSRLADDYLWAEVLNLGGYDVLAKPLDAEELRRTMNLAWERWASLKSLLPRRSASRPSRRSPVLSATA